MFSFFRRAVSDYFPKPISEPLGGRPFVVDPMINHKRDAIYASPQMGFLTSQDFLEEIDRRTVIVNGSEVPIIVKADFDIIGASIGDKRRHALIRDRRENRFVSNDDRR